MEFGLFEFSDQLNKYFRGELTKNELGMWGEKAFYDLLKGGYIENKKIVLYPFLKTVSKFHIEENDAEDIYPSTEDDLKYIQAILMGEVAFSFQVTISIPSNIFVNAHCGFWDAEKVRTFSEVKCELDKLICEGKIKHSISKLAEIIRMPLSENTVLDTLQGYIVQFSRELFNDGDFITKPPLRLYARKESAELGLVKLKDMIECYIGDKNFIVTVIYKKGTPKLSVFC